MDLKYSREGVTVSSVLDSRRINVEKKYPAKICVIYKRKTKFFSTGLKLTDEQWRALAATKKVDLVEQRIILQKVFDKIKLNCDALLDEGCFDFYNLIIRLRGIESDIDLQAAYQTKIGILRENGQVGSAISYDFSLKSLVSFSKTLCLAEINPTWLKAYEKWMLANGKSHTTVGIYLRSLKAIYNELILSGVVPKSSYPFGKGKYDIPRGKGRKLALSLEDVKRIMNYSNVDGCCTFAEYRDLWVFSYLCNGANFNDILRLKYQNIVGDELYFFRQKTINTTSERREVVAYLTPEMKTIIERWGTKPVHPGAYIFKYLKGDESPEKQRAIILDVIKRTNKRLLIISKDLDLPKVTTYTARHSYATVLKRSGANIAYISESLGHSDLKTTEHYLAGFETEERKKNAALLTAFGVNNAT